MTSSEVETPQVQYVDRNHSWGKCIFISSGLSLCITVDILQYSMPLAFMPSVLEDRGHSAMHIATAIGIYYWTGFLGCFIITSFQMYRLLFQKPKNSNECQTTDFATVQRHIKFLIVGLGIGTATLAVQAMHPRWIVHVTCRFIQGFAGAFIFFYAFLLSVSLFKSSKTELSQQNVATTFASCALNVAEVFGSFFGAICFDVWGQRGVFWILAIISVFNQLFLIWILYYEIKPTDLPEEEIMSSRGSHRSSPLPLPPKDLLGLDGPDAAGGPARPAKTCGCLPPVQPGAIEKLKEMFENRELLCAIILIATAAVVKGSVEEMLPFHCDHRWGMLPMEIGKQFCIIATTYIVAAIVVGNFWNRFGIYKVGFSAYWLLMLGIVAWGVFAIVSYTKSENMLACGLAFYGITLGMTHTPAALLLAGVIDTESHGAAKDAVNGIFHTMWEAGGSLGFLLGGLLAARYHEQMALLTWYTIACAFSAMTMVTISTWPADGFCVAKDKLEKIDSKTYGSTSDA